MDYLRSYRDSVEYWKHVAIDLSGYQSDDSPWSDRAILVSLLDARTAEMNRRMLQGIEINKHVLLLTDVCG